DSAASLAPGAVGPNETATVSIRAAAAGAMTSPGAAVRRAVRVAAACVLVFVAADAAAAGCVSDMGRIALGSFFMGQATAGCLIAMMLSISSAIAAMSRAAAPLRCVSLGVPPHSAASP